MHTNIKSNPTKTLITIVSGFLVFNYFLDKDWMLWVATILGLVGVFSNYLSSKIEILWFGLAKVLGFIFPNILLSLVFYFFLFPLSILSKIFKKKDHLMLKKTNKSTFVESNKTFKSEDLKYPW